MCVAFWQRFDGAIDPTHDHELRVVEFLALLICKLVGHELAARTESRDSKLFALEFGDVVLRRFCRHMDTPTQRAGDERAVQSDPAAPANGSDATFGEDGCQVDGSVLERSDQCTGATVKVGERDLDPEVGEGVVFERSQPRKVEWLVNAAYSQNSLMRTGSPQPLGSTTVRLYFLPPAQDV